MAQANEHPPGLLGLLRRIASTSLGLLLNRFELLVLEWQEENSRLIALLLWSAAVVFLSIMGLILLPAIIIFLFPENLRIYAGFALLYLIGATFAWLGLRTQFQHDLFRRPVSKPAKIGCGSNL